MPYDMDLNPVLEGALNDELQMLSNQMENRLTEGFTSTERYIEAASKDDFISISDILADELREFGGHTLMNLKRGEGPAYSVILRDVAKTLKLKPAKTDSVETIGMSIIMKQAEKMWSEMSEEERQDILGDLPSTPKSTSFPIVAIHTYVRSLGFLPYKLILKLINRLSKYILKRGISLAGNAFAVKLLAKTLSTKINIALWLWVANDLLSPAYRVTIPCIMIVELSRQRQLAEANSCVCTNCDKLLNKDDNFCSGCGHKMK